MKSPTLGLSHQGLLLRSLKSMVKESGANSLKILLACSNSLVLTDVLMRVLMKANVSGLNRMYASLNFASSVSLPAKIRIWPRSDSGFGEKVMTPSPNSTRPVTPLSFSETNAEPFVMRSVKSSPGIVRLVASYCVPRIQR